MSWTDQPGMMRTSGGVSIVARAGLTDASTAGVVLFVTSIQTRLTADESRQLRDLLQAAELDAARGNVIT